MQESAAFDKGIDSRVLNDETDKNILLSSKPSRLSLIRPAYVMPSRNPVFFRDKSHSDPVF